MEDPEERTEASVSNKERDVAAEGLKWREKSTGQEDMISYGKPTTVAATSKTKVKSRGGISTPDFKGTKKEAAIAKADNRDKTAPPKQKVKGKKRQELIDEEIRDQFEDYTVELQKKSIEKSEKKSLNSTLNSLIITSSNNFRTFVSAFENMSKGDPPASSPAAISYEVSLYSPMRNSKEVRTLDFKETPTSGYDIKASLTYIV